MRRLPHLATLLRPAEAEDDYGDTVDGELAPVGDPFPAWLQIKSSEEDVLANGQPVSTRPKVYVLPSAPHIDEDDVLEVSGQRFRVTGDPYPPVNPRGRSRFVQIDLIRVTRGGS